MTKPSGPRARRARRGRSTAALLALGALLLTGCDDAAEDDTAQASDAAGDSDDGANTGGSDDNAAGDGEGNDGDAETADVEGEDAEGEDAEGEPAPAPTEPADIEVAAGDREASQGDGQIFATGAPVAFTSPTGNISCVMTTSNATCQVSDKTFTAPGDQLVGSSLGSCNPEDADAIILSEEQGAWTCPPQPLAPIGALGQSGWWAAQIDGDTVEVDGVEVAALPYGQDLKLGSVTCNATEQGVTCQSEELGKQIFVSRTAYRYG